MPAVKGSGPGSNALFAVRAACNAFPLKLERLAMEEHLYPTSTYAYHRPRRTSRTVRYNSPKTGFYVRGSP